MPSDADFNEIDRLQGANGTAVGALSVIDLRPYCQPLRSAAPAEFGYELVRVHQFPALHWRAIDTAFGPMCLVGAGETLYSLNFGAELEPAWQGATHTPDLPDLDSGHWRRLALRGSEFEWAVWQGLARIAPGELTTYGALASFVGRPGGARAVGGAVGRNPIAWLLPCHRVVATNGKLGGYSGGLSYKIALLERELGLTLPGQLTLAM